MPGKPRAGGEWSTPALWLHNQLMESKEARCPAQGLRVVPVAQKGRPGCGSGGGDTLPFRVGVTRKVFFLHAGLSHRV